MKSKRFRLYSIAVEIRGALAPRLALDFDFFTDRGLERKKKDKYFVSLETAEGDPKSVSLPDRAADQVFPDCVLYREGGRFFYEYGGATLVVEREKNSCRGKLLASNPLLAEEIGYLFLQSEIGRFLDRQGFHRVHALGLGLPSGKAALVLLPSGGGKSTLALEFLKKEGCVLLSDDTPLVDRWGRVWPFPLRLSFRPDTALPTEWKTHLFERRRHGPKLLVPTTSLPSDRLPRPGDSFRPGFLILGVRHGTRNKPMLGPLGRWKGALGLVRDLVVGLGVPQVAELLLTRGVLSLPGLAPVGASRLAAAAAYVSRAKVRRLELSRDVGANAQCLLDLFKQEGE